jgi:hypothetical protein
VIRHWPDLTGRPTDLNASFELPVLYRIRERMMDMAFSPNARLVPSSVLFPLGLEIAAED